MKTFVAVLALAALVATSAVARNVKADTGYHSYAQGSQAYENPDRTYGNGNEPAAQ